MLTDSQSQTVLVRMVSERILTLPNSNTLKQCQVMPNGIARIRTLWGWLYIRADGSIHSRQYN